MADRLVTISTFDDPIAAAMARNFLESEGIPAILMDESSVATDWLLSNAIGGIKLQVSSYHLERAELLLTTQHPHGEDREEEDALPETALATREAATELSARQKEIDADLHAEKIDETPCNQLADRLLRTTVLGFLFFPLQFYALWLMVLAFGAFNDIDPGRRWKIWLSIPLNLPLMACAVLLLSCLLTR